jgi:hypothetical protein
MKGKILFGSIFSVCILLLLPSIPAVEYKVAIDSNEIEVNGLMKIIQFDITDIKEKIKDIDHKELEENLKNVVFKSLKDKINDNDFQNMINQLDIEINDQDSEPKFIIILSLIKLVLRIISFIVGFGGFLVKSIINIISLIIFVIIFIIQLVINSILTLILSILSILILLIDTILQAIYDIISPNIVETSIIQ